MRTFAQRQKQPQPEALSNFTRSGIRSLSNHVGIVAPPIVHEVLHSPGQPVDPATRGFIESRFGHDFSKVKVHADQRAGAAASAVGARAFTLNRNIVFGPGEYAPKTESGRLLLSHELAHVAQQARDNSAPLATGVPLVLGDAHGRAESEARRVADEVGRGSFASVRTSQARNSVILREPLAPAPQQSPKGDKARLKKLFAAVKASSVGKKFIGYAGGEPNVVWGATGGGHGEFDGSNTITLNETEESQLNDCQWQQVIAMELGNFANATLLESVYGEGEKGNLGKDDFVRAIEKIEYDSRDLVIEAYESGEFGAPGPDCPPIFTGGRIPFEDYIKDPRGAAHRAAYEDQWEQYCKKAYLKKHPTK
jgi:hypothetical protein